MNIQQQLKKLRIEWLKLPKAKKKLLKPIFIRRAKALKMGTKDIIKEAKKIFEIKEESS